MKDNVDSNMTLGTNASPVAIDAGGNGDYTPLQALNRIKRYLDLESVPMEDRWFVADPVFWEMMQDEDSKLMDVDYSHDNDSILRNGQVTRRPIRGFRVMMSNNMPTVGTGPTATTGSNYGWILAGHQSAVATAEQIRKTESYRDQNSFADVVRGLHIFGRKLLRPESLVAIRYQSA